MDVGHSFIQILKSCFFCEAEKTWKKTQACFFFPGKVHRSFIRIFDGFLFFLIKVGCVFFFRDFGVFFCVFFFPGKVHKPFIHSNFWAAKKNNPGKKKTAFLFIHSKSFKNAQKRTFPCKKKYDIFGPNGVNSGGCNNLDRAEYLHMLLGLKSTKQSYEISPMKILF